MAGYKLMEHTADVGIVATGNSFAEALAWAGEGMLRVMVDLDQISPREQIEVSVKSADSESLVVDWLNELLYKYEAEGFIPRKFQLSVDEAETELSGLCLGERRDPEQRPLSGSVKAATYHNLKVSHDGHWRIQVVLDV